MLDAKIQIYTGDGKGKTTAAFGLCLRAVGHGNSAFIVQFRKSAECGEHISAETLGIQVLRCAGGRKSPTCSKPCRLLVEAGNIIEKEQPDIIVLDEIMAAIKNGCVTTKEVIMLLEGAGGRTEIVMTGRNAPAELLAAADLITSMEPLKHFFEEGIRARKGIEY